MKVHCDVCGLEAPVEAAVIRVIDGDLLYFCSFACARRAASRRAARRGATSSYAVTRLA